MSIRERIGGAFYIILLNTHRRAGGQYFPLPENLLKQLVTLERSGRIRISSCAQREESHPRTKGCTARESAVPAAFCLYTGTHPFHDGNPAVSRKTSSRFHSGSQPFPCGDAPDRFSRWPFHSVDRRDVTGDKIRT